MLALRSTILSPGGKQTEGDKHMTVSMFRTCCNQGGRPAVQASQLHLPQSAQRLAAHTTKLQYLSRKEILHPRCWLPDHHCRHCCQRPDAHTQLTHHLQCALLLLCHQRLWQQSGHAETLVSLEAYCLQDMHMSSSTYNVEGDYRELCENAVLCCALCCVRMLCADAVLYDA